MAKKKVSGRGKKTCPECGTSVGVRTLECTKCHHKFAMKSKIAKPRKTSEPSSLKNELIAEKKRLEEMLQNRQQMEERLEKINALLETWEE